MDTRELQTYEEIETWRSARSRIGFIGSDETMALQCDIWTIELFSQVQGGFSVLITLDSDESWLVCDFECV